MTVPEKLYNHIALDVDLWYMMGAVIVLPEGITH